jgi:hypothetical protein
MVGDPVAVEGVVTSTFTTDDAPSGVFVQDAGGGLSDPVER